MSKSIGQILGELTAGEITKQQAVTALQRNRSHSIKREKLQLLKEVGESVMGAGLEQKFKNTYQNWEGLARLNPKITRQDLIDFLIEDCRTQIIKSIKELKEEL